MGTRISFALVAVLVALVLSSCNGDDGVSSPVDHTRPGSLDILRVQWRPASQPADANHSYRNRVDNFIWFNPIELVRTADIYPNLEITSQVPDRVHVLSLELLRDTQSENDSSTWAGVMQALAPENFDQSQTQFIEVMVQGNTGRLHLDFGVISEDVIPNQILDTEDRPDRGIRNGVLDTGEDTGLDGIAKPDPPELLFPRGNHAGEAIADVPYDFWDVNRNGIKDADEPWSYDDWFYVTQAAQYLYEGEGSINGSEGNADDELGRLPNSEDINANGLLDLDNHYFSYSFSLQKAHADTSLIVGGHPAAGWYLYRIPFTGDAADAVVGSASPSRIESVRIWLDELDSAAERTRARIAELVLVECE